MEMSKYGMRTRVMKLLLLTSLKEVVLTGRPSQSTEIKLVISSVVNLKIWNLNDMTVRTLRNIKMLLLQVSQFHDPNKLLISTTNEMSSAKPRIFEYDLESVNKPAQVLELRKCTPVFCIQSSDNGSFFLSEAVLMKLREFGLRKSGIHQANLLIRLKNMRTKYSSHLFHLMPFKW